MAWLADIHQTTLTNFSQFGIYYSNLNTRSQAPACRESLPLYALSILCMGIVFEHGEVLGDDVFVNMFGGGNYQVTVWCID